jgi:hypothetical protein
MRSTLVILALGLPGLVSPAAAQTSSLEFQAGLGYAHAFDGGGPSFAAAAERLLSPQSNRLQHALGGSLWYSEMSVGSRSNSANDRKMLGLGIRYQLEFKSGGARPFLALPLQLLRSSVADITTIQGASLAVTGVPNTGAPTPIEDRAGSDWGFGTGIELGLRLGLAPGWSAQTSVQGLYHRIYDSSRRNSAWTIHGGITYRP